MEDTAKRKMEYWEVLFEDSLEADLRDEIYEELGLFDDSCSINLGAQKLTELCRKEILKFQNQGGYDLGFKVFTILDLMVCTYTEIYNYLFEGAYESENYKKCIAHIEYINTTLDTIEKFFDYDEEVFDKEIFPTLAKHYSMINEHLIENFLKANQVLDLSPIGSSNDANKSLRRLRK